MAAMCASNACTSNSSRRGFRKRDRERVRGSGRERERERYRARDRAREIERERNFEERNTESEGYGDSWSRTSGLGSWVKGFRD